MDRADEPRPFQWGVATSALQIEGAPSADGRGRSIWEDFQEKPGAIANGDRVDPGSHHYEHHREDVELLSWLGVDAYRFSIAWPRVLPEGRGEVNPAGLGFYDRLVDDLLAAGIEPVATLYHWDLPSALQDGGGWTVRSTAEAFAQYAAAVVGALGDRVTTWVTHNEPAVTSLLGHAEGVFAPGIADTATAVRAAHEILVSHGLAVRSIREASPAARVGIVLDINVLAPAVDDEAHHEATRLFDGQLHRWFLDPVSGRGYPEDAAAYYGAAMVEPAPGDLDLIAEPTDFIGVNYYRLDAIEPAPAEDWRAGRPVERDVPHTAMGWEIHPDGLREVLHRVAGYGHGTIYVTENGAAFDDRVEDGEVHDPDRIEYLAGHIAAVERARDEGVPVNGYFLWSFVDNFEWASGYDKRFGIIWSDPGSYLRIPKDSAHWYRQFLAART